MQKQTIHQHQGLTGTERYGTVHGVETSALMPSYVQADTELAPPSGVEYGLIGTCIGQKIGTVEKCSAPKAQGTDYCIGHLRRITKEQRQETEEILELQKSRNELIDAEIQE
jgi:hypothetical protein